MFPEGQAVKISATDFPGFLHDYKLGTQPANHDNLAQRQVDMVE
jgi:hypothetical protein